MRILIIGDIIGRPGRLLTVKRVPKIRFEEKIDFIIANGENLAGGVGITRETAEDLFRAGVDAITTGNHVWKKREFFEYLERGGDLPIFRPANYPEGCPGRGVGVVTAHGNKVGIINVQGRIFMEPIDCPFRAAKAGAKQLQEQGAKVIIVDMHAEATSEKRAMGFYLDGVASAVVGTHTHIQTADEEIQAGGTAYLTDLGMVGARRSVIGVEVEPIIHRFLTQLPVRFDVAEVGDMVFSAALIDVDANTGRATAIRRIREIIAPEN